MNALELHGSVEDPLSQRILYLDYKIIKYILCRKESRSSNRTMEMCSTQK